MTKKIILGISIILIISGIIFSFLKFNSNQELSNNDENNQETENKDTESDDDVQEELETPVTKICVKEGNKFKFQYTIYVYKDGNFEKYDYYHSEIVESNDTYDSVISSDGSIQYEYSDSNASKKEELKDQTFKDDNGNIIRTSYEYYKSILEASGYTCN